MADPLDATNELLVVVVGRRLVTGRRPDPDSEAARRGADIVFETCSPACTSEFERAVVGKPPIALVR